MAHHAIDGEGGGRPGRTCTHVYVCQPGHRAAEQNRNPAADRVAAMLQIQDERDEQQEAERREAHHWIEAEERYQDAVLSFQLGSLEATCAWEEGVMLRVQDELDGGALYCAEEQYSRAWLQHCIASEFRTLVMEGGNFVGAWQVDDAVGNIRCYEDDYDCHARDKRDDVGELRFPAGFTEIGSGAFLNCINISNPRLPTGLLCVGARAFANCWHITALHLPASLRTIGNAAFAGCCNLATVEFPEDLVSIGHAAFKDCTALTALVLPAGLRSVGGESVLWDSSCQYVNFKGAFSGCTRLVRVLAPDALVRGDMADLDQRVDTADLVEVFNGCPVLASGLTPYSAVKPLRRHFWHPTMHLWCTGAANAAVVALLIVELRVDQRDQQPLPPLPHDVWLLILEFVERRGLGPPPV